MPLQLHVDTTNLEAAERDANELLRLQFPVDWSDWTILPEMDWTTVPTDNLAAWNDPTALAEGITLADGTTLANSTTVDPKVFDISGRDSPELEDSTVPVSRWGTIPGCRRDLLCMQLHRASTRCWRFRRQI